ncbi:hypothetical protein BC834DRAFT_78652 [Gloeopeniophorella convolvens]|nr:hypothetical protein BC834DRAFT_78652 [Gloeopeniophorella convolvens]
MVGGLLQCCSSHFSNTSCTTYCIHKHCNIAPIRPCVDSRRRRSRMFNTFHHVMNGGDAVKLSTSLPTCTCHRSPAASASSPAVPRRAPHRDSLPSTPTGSFMTVSIHTSAHAPWPTLAPPSATRSQRPSDGCVSARSSAMPVCGSLSPLRLRVAAPAPAPALATGSASCSLPFPYLLLVLALLRLRHRRSSRRV